MENLSGEEEETERGGAPLEHGLVALVDTPTYVFRIDSPSTVLAYG